MSFLKQKIKPYSDQISLKIQCGIIIESIFFWDSVGWTISSKSEDPNCLRVKGLVFQSFNFSILADGECAQSCPTLCDLMHCNPPCPSIHGILQARILEQVAISYSRGSSPPRNQIQVSSVSCIGRWILYHCTTRKDVLTLIYYIFNSLFPRVFRSFLQTYSPSFVVSIFYSFSLTLYYKDHSYRSIR